MSKNISQHLLFCLSLAVAHLFFSCKSGNNKAIRSQHNVTKDCKDTFCEEQSLIFWEAVDLIYEQKENRKKCKSVNTLKQQLNQLKANDPLALVHFRLLLESIEINSVNDTIYFYCEDKFNDLVKHLNNQLVCSIDYKTQAIKNQSSCWKRMQSFRSKYGLKLCYENNQFIVCPNFNYVFRLTEANCSPKLKQCLKAKQEDEKEGFLENSTLRISYHQLGKRIVKWEQIKIENNTEPYLCYIDKQIQLYLQVYLYGSKGSELFDKAHNRLLPVVQENYELFIKQNPNLPSTQIVKDRYEQLKANNFIDPEKSKPFLGLF